MIKHVISIDVFNNFKRTKDGMEISMPLEGRSKTNDPIEDGI